MSEPSELETRVAMDVLAEWCDHARRNRDQLGASVMWEAYYWLEYQVDPHKFPEATDGR